MNSILIPADLFQDLVKYLTNQPWKDVDVIIDRINSCYAIDETQTNEILNQIRKTKTSHDNIQKPVPE